MKPSKAEREPSHWYRSSDTWDGRKEQLTARIWLTCYRRPDEFKDNKPAMWVYVHRHNKDTGLDDRDVIERIRFEDDDPLMLECVAHEMRKKYGVTP